MLTQSLLQSTTAIGLTLVFTPRGVRLGTMGRHSPQRPAQPRQGLPRDCPGHGLLFPSANTRAGQQCLTARTQALLLPPLGATVACRLSPVNSEALTVEASLEAKSTDKNRWINLVIMRNVSALAANRQPGGGVNPLWKDLGLCKLLFSIRQQYQLCQGRNRALCMRQVQASPLPWDVLR